MKWAEYLIDTKKDLRNKIDWLWWAGWILLRVGNWVVQLMINSFIMMLWSKIKLIKPRGSFLLTFLRKATSCPLKNAMAQKLQCSKRFHDSFIVFTVISLASLPKKHKQNPHNRNEVSISSFLSDSLCRRMEKLWMDRKLNEEFSEHFRPSRANLAMTSLRFFSKQWKNHFTAFYCKELSH